MLQTGPDRLAWADAPAETLIPVPWSCIKPSQSLILTHQLLHLSVYRCLIVPGRTADAAQVSNIPREMSPPVASRSDGFAKCPRQHVEILAQIDGNPCASTHGMTDRRLHDVVGCMGRVETRDQVGSSHFTVGPDEEVLTRSRQCPSPRLLVFYGTGSWVSQALASNFETRVHLIIMPIIVARRCATIVQHSAACLASCCSVPQRCTSLPENQPCAPQQPQRLIYRRRWLLTLTRHPSQPSPARGKG
jgi:hypothetical protein